MARSLNKVTLIGNLTRDPELRYTGNGTGVCSFGLATNRQWSSESGEKKDSVEYHKIVAWNKLAELCSQLLSKGRKVYVEGRLQTRKWTGQDNVEKTTTEIIITDMIILDSRGAVSGEEYSDIPDDLDEAAPLEEDSAAPAKPAAKPTAAKKPAVSAEPAAADDEEDIPF